MRSKIKDYKNKEKEKKISIQWLAVLVAFIFSFKQI